MANYVKFYRGSSVAFENLLNKNSDTLYFITDSDSNKSSLYIGDKLIIGGITSLSELNDIVLSNSVDDNQALIFDKNQNKWINKSLIDAIGVVIGATKESQGNIGLVPAPGIGQNNMFLRGDGQWANPGTSVKSDNKSIELLKDDITLSLKNFGKKYYRRGNNENEYILQIVDADNPWIEGLEPRVVEENGELVLGWFQPSSTTIEGVSSQLETLSNRVNIVAEAVSTKANASSVYSKEETDNKIAAAIINSDHLVRKIFDTLTEAQEFASEAGDNAGNYVYMVLNSEDGEEGNRYLEYLYIENTLELVGTWKANLSDYVTFDILENFVRKVDGYGLISNTDVAKLATIEEGAQKNLFDSVDNSQFFINENKKLTIKEIGISTVSGLSNLIEGINDKINEKAAELQVIKSDIIEINNTVSDLNTIVSNFENNFVSKNKYNTDMKVIDDSITWHELN